MYPDRSAGAPVWPRHLQRWLARMPANAGTRDGARAADGDADGDESKLAPCPPTDAEPALRAA